MSVLHLHLILNHVPVIGTAFVLLMLGVSVTRRNEGMARLGLGVMVGLAAITAIVFLTGEPAEEAVERVAGVSEAMIHPHEEAAEAALIATTVVGALALLALAAFRRRALPRWVTGSALVAVFGVSVLLGWTANLGGRIRHTELGATAQAQREAEDRDH
jgi:multisubunit Na+/H+ antiporter MnhC subunit